MDLELNAEHLAVRDAARGFLDRNRPLAAAQVEDDRRTDELWHGIGQLGWLDLGTGSEDDVFGVVGAVIVAAELGRHAVPIPFSEHTAVASRVLNATGALSQRRAWQAGLAAGAPVCTAAVLESGCDWSLEGISAAAHREHGDWRVSGRKTAVPFATTAGAVAVIARGPEGLNVFLVESGTPGLTFEPESGFDATRVSSTVVLDRVSVNADAALAGPEVEPALLNALAVAAVTTSAEGYGAADALLDLAVVHAKERNQFGRPIGSFQALAHLMADLHVLRETTWSTVLHAAASIDAELDSAVASARIASAHAARSIRTIGEGALQVLGGIGFSQEHSAHVLFGRVLECEQRFGDALTHERALSRDLCRVPAALVA